MYLVNFKLYDIIDDYAARMYASDMQEFKKFVSGMYVIRSNDEAEQVAGFYGTALFATDIISLKRLTEISNSQEVQKLISVFLVV